MKDEQFYWELIRGRFNKTNSPVQENLLAEWVNESESNKDYYSQCIQVLEASRVKETVFDLEGNWSRFETEIEKTSPVTHRPRFVVLSRLAAIVLLGVCVLLVAYTMFWKDSLVTLSSAEAPMRIALPDSSEVWLNAHTTISYSNDFGKSDRVVTLEGEAFFDVRKDQTRPFIIHTIRSVTQVVGTSFNLKTEDGADELTVVTGLVSMSNKARSVETLAEPGSRILATADQVIKSSFVPLSSALQWKPKRFTFDRTPLSEVIQTIEAHYGIDILLDDNAARCTFTGKFQNVDYNEILNGLSLAVGLVLEEQNGRILLSGGGCDE